MFQPGDKVFAKMKGFPFWPARVEAVPSYVDVPKGKLPVFFYGTHQVSFLTAKNLINYEINRDSHGKGKNLVKAMAEIESDPDILCLGKDPAAESFWESLYPNGAPRVQKSIQRSDQVDSSGLSSRSISPASKRSVKRKIVSKTKRESTTKRRKSQNKDDDLNTLSSLSDVDMDNPYKKRTEDSGMQSLSKPDIAASLPSTAETDDEHESTLEKEPLDRPLVKNSFKRRRNTPSVPGPKRHRKEVSSSETASLSGESKSEDGLKTLMAGGPTDLENRSNGAVLPPLTPQLEIETEEHEISSLEEERSYRERKTRAYRSNPKKHPKQRMLRRIVDLDADATDEEEQDEGYQKEAQLTGRNGGSEEHAASILPKVPSEEQLVMVNNEPDSESNDSSQNRHPVDSTIREKFTEPKSGQSSPAKSDHMPLGDVTYLRSGSVMELPKTNSSSTPPSQIEEADESNSSRPAAVEAPRSSDEDSEDEITRIRKKEWKVEQHERYSDKSKKRSVKEFTAPKSDKSGTQSPPTPVFQESEKSESKTPRSKSHKKPKRETEQIQMLHDLCVKLKSSLVKGHENFEAAVRVLHRVGVADVSLSQITQVWELTDCVKKCRKYRLSAEVRAAADKAMQHFQGIQATASREELHKAKIIIEERQRARQESAAPAKTPPLPAAPAPPPADPPSSSSTSDPTVVTPNADASVVETAQTSSTPGGPSTPMTSESTKRRFTLEELRAELDEKANSVLAHIAALEERLKNSSSNVRTTPTGVFTPAAAVVGHPTEVTASDVVLSRVDAVATRLRVPDVVVGNAPAASGLSPPPPPPPPLPLPLGGTLNNSLLVPSSSGGGPVDLETRIHQLMGGGVGGGAMKAPAVSSSEKSVTQSKLLALREQIQKKRRAASVAAAARKAKEDRGKSADDDIYDLLGV